MFDIPNLHNRRRLSEMVYLDESSVQRNRENIFFSQNLEILKKESF